MPDTDPSDLGPMIEDMDPPYDELKPDDEPSASQFGITHGPSGLERGRFGLTLIGLGFAFLILGGALVIARTLVRQSNSTFNQACSVIPDCHPGADLTVGLDSIGIAMIVVGLLFALLGVRRSMGRSAWGRDET